MLEGTRNVGVLILTGKNEVFREKIVPLPLFPPQIPYRLY